MKYVVWCLVLCAVCFVRCAAHTYWLGYRCQGCGPHTVFSVAIILVGMRRNKDSAHVWCPLCVNEPNRFGGRNDPIDSLEQVMEMKDYAPTYPTSSAQCFSSNSCFWGWKNRWNAGILFLPSSMWQVRDFMLCKGPRIVKPLTMHWKPERIHSFGRRPFRPEGTFQIYVHK